MINNVKTLDHKHIAFFAEDLKLNYFSWGSAKIKNFQKMKVSKNHFKQGVTKFSFDVHYQNGQNPEGYVYTYYNYTNTEVNFNSIFSEIIKNSLRDMGLYYVLSGKTSWGTFCAPALTKKGHLTNPINNSGLEYEIFYKKVSKLFHYLNDCGFPFQLYFTLTRMTLLYPTKEDAQEIYSYSKYIDEEHQKNLTDLFLVYFEVKNKP